MVNDVEYTCTDPLWTRRVNGRLLFNAKMSNLSAIISWPVLHFDEVMSPLSTVMFGFIFIVLEKLIETSP